MTARVPGIRRRPPIYVGLPKIDDAEDSDTKSAMAIRAVTWVSGKCPACGAEPEVTPHPEVSVAVVSFQHDADCPVAELLDPSGP